MNSVEIICLILTIFLGLCFGSFLNVCIYRTEQKNFFSNTRSYCPKCKHTLSVWDNIPILSYIFLKGKCRYCKEKISFRYPLVEILNTVLWLAVYLVYKVQYITLIYMILVSLLIVMSFIDMDTMEIPNRIIVIAFILALISFAPIDNISWQDKLIGMVAVSIPMFLVAILTNGMGLADVKLYFVLGLLFGWKQILVIFLFSVIIGSIAGIIILIKNKKREKRMEIPFGPSIALGTVINLLVGEKIIYFYANLLGLA